MGLFRTLASSGIACLCLSMSMASSATTYLSRQLVVSDLALRCLHDPSNQQIGNLPGGTGVEIKSGTVKTTEDFGLPVSDADRANGITFEGMYQISFVYRQTGTSAPEWEQGRDSFYTEIKNGTLDFSENIDPSRSKFCHYRQRLK